MRLMVREIRYIHMCSDNTGVALCYISTKGVYNVRCFSCTGSFNVSNNLSVAEVEFESLNQACVFINTNYCYYYGHYSVELSECLIHYVVTSGGTCDM